MKFLNPPLVFNGRRIKLAAENAKLTKLYPALNEDLEIIRKEYAGYIKNKGNPWYLPSIKLEEENHEGLKYYYNNPPKIFDYIRVLRDDLSPDLCPTCGSPGNGGQLDHYMPKEKFQVFTVFSWNLIPACRCNQKKSEMTIGEMSSKERFLHPYYDHFLNERLYSVQITGQNFPNVEMKIIQNYSSGEADGPIRFHLKNLISKTQIMKTFERRWNVLVQNPASIISSLPSDGGLLSREEFSDHMKVTLDRLDEKYGSKNNWESIFLHGVSEASYLHDYLRHIYNS